MKKYILALLATSLLSATAFLWSIEPPPQHTEPTVMCSPSHHENNERCKCLSMWAGEMNCKEGKLVTETQMCSSFCWKDWCGCCAAMDKMKQPPKKGKK